MLGTLDASNGTGRVEQPSPKKSHISLGRRSGKSLQNKPERKLSPIAMEAIEHHSKPESDEPDQAKRMQTSLSHLNSGKTMSSRSLRRTYCVTQRQYGRRATKLFFLKRHFDKKTKPL
jgi:hypothetical protein